MPCGGGSFRADARISVTTTALCCALGAGEAGREGGIAVLRTLCAQMNPAIPWCEQLPRETPWAESCPVGSAVARDAREYGRFPPAPRAPRLAARRAACRELGSVTWSTRLGVGATPATLAAMERGQRSTAAAEPLMGSISAISCGAWVGVTASRGSRPRTLGVGRHASRVALRCGVGWPPRRGSASDGGPRTAARARARLSRSRCSNSQRVPRVGRGNAARRVAALCEAGKTPGGDDAGAGEHSP